MKNDEITLTFTMRGNPVVNTASIRRICNLSWKDRLLLRRRRWRVNAYRQYVRRNGLGKRMRKLTKIDNQYALTIV